VPGVNAPIPHGSSYGYQLGGWGKPPVDPSSQPVYGNPFDAPNVADSIESAPEAGLYGSGSDVSSLQISNAAANAGLGVVSRALWGQTSTQDAPTVRPDRSSTGDRFDPKLN